MSGVQVSARWKLDLDDVPVHANQTLVQLGQGNDVYIVFGHVNPPIVDAPAGTVELTQDMVHDLVLPVVPVARVMLDVNRARELLEGLQTALATLEAQAEQ